MESVANLVENARAGDAAAFEALVARFEANAHARAYQVLRDHQRAEDVVQEAFFEAYRCLDNLREPAAFPGFFKRIVIKQIDRVTRVRRRDTVSLESAADAEWSPPEALDAGQSDSLVRALRNLPDRERAVAEPYYLHGQAQKDISEALGVPLGTIKKRLFTARGRLRAQLGDYAPEAAQLEALACPRSRIVAAVTGGYVRKVDELVSCSPGLVDERTADGLNLLLAAIDAGFRRGAQDVAHLLVLKGAALSPHALAGLGRWSALRRAIGQNRTRLESRDAWQRTPLHWAAAGGHTDIVDWLLSAGADVDATDDFGCTPLLLAVEHGRADVVDRLIAGGASLQATLRNGKSAVHLAAATGDIALVEALLSRGCGFDIFAAARLGMPEIVESYLDRNRGAVRAKLPYGATVLHLAAEGGHDKVARTLMDAGAELDVVGAAELGWIDELEKLLRDQPEQVHAQGGSFGFTPLHTASSRGDRDTARLLLAAGAKPGAVDRMYRKTPLDEAIYYGKEAMAQLLSATTAGTL